ncbi:hypothetical protein M8C21_023617 [Ambrosia artemisiifolia]|uniref:NAD(P)H oxidase (H(2)O(2)-forming) n=1 Tax=Ambrosia artemisiifolia TaxID=4212 RepID=A0AAD5D9T7_AMBAR|nr:hypothetical protein M8C21_023617 [Ambrosia artemisiifolia]
MISIVKDILNNLKSKEEEENALENGATLPILQKNKSGARSRTNFSTTRAYFYWVTNQQGTFIWFKGVMNEAAEMDKNGVIEMHNYCTTIYKEGDITSAIITMIQKIDYANKGVDVVSNTLMMSHSGKPDWRSVFTRIARTHTGVFYYGNPDGQKVLKQLPSDFSHKTSTNRKGRHQRRTTTSLSLHRHNASLLDGFSWQQLSEHFELWDLISQGATTHPYCTNCCPEVIRLSSVESHMMFPLNLHENMELAIGWAKLVMNNSHNKIVQPLASKKQEGNCLLFCQLLQSVLSHVGCNASFRTKSARRNVREFWMQLTGIMDTTDDGYNRVPGNNNHPEVVLHNVKAAADMEEQNAPKRVRPLSAEFKHLNSFTKQRVVPLDMKTSTATHALERLKFISMKDDGPTAWAIVEKQFDGLTDASGFLQRSHFGECIGLIRKKKVSTNSGRMNEVIEEDSRYFSERLFDSLCRRRNITNESINKAQFREFWDQISDQSVGSRIQTFFDVVDKDGDGRITKDEVTEIINLSALDNKLSNIPKKVDEYATLIMEELDKDSLGYITIESLETLLFQEPTHYVIGESKNLSQMLGQKLKTTPHELNLITKWYEDLKNETKLGVVIPFDDNINFHQVIAVAIAIGVGLHAICHLACDFPRLIHATEEEYKPMQQFFGDQPKSYCHFLKEVECYTGITMVVLMTIAFTLAWLRQGQLKVPLFFKRLMKLNATKSSKRYDAFVKKLAVFITVINKFTGFNVFWYSHHLFVIVYAMLIVHGINLYLTKEWYKKTTWMYLAVPILLYACERLIRTFRSRLIPAPLRKVAVYPGNVLTLHMTKPQGFKYKSGQYMFVKYVPVSPFEWHPFSITSAPGDDYLSVHIRALGDWTKDMNKTFKDQNSRLQIIRFIIPKILIDGPYGAPAVDYKKYDVVLLVGLGIGATPMISIVKDILNNMKAKDEEENTLENGVTLQKNKSGSRSSKYFRIMRAYFYWVTGQQCTFDWFKGVMNEVAELDKNGVIEMHNYCTSVYEEGDARSTFIAMLQAIGYAKKGVDVVSDTRVMSHFGKPNWRNVYTRIVQNHTGSKIG